MILLSEPRFGFEEEFNLWLSDEPLNDKEICKLMRLVEDQRKAEGEAP